jgi:hypothetical protein
MAYIVYITNECNKEAKKHGYINSLQKIKEDIEKTQELYPLDRFPREYYVTKKKYNYHIRAVAHKKDYQIEGEEYALIIFLGVMTKGSEDYQEITDNIKKGKGKKLANYLNRYTDKEYTAPFCQHKK